MKKILLSILFVGIATMLFSQEGFVQAKFKGEQPVGKFVADRMVNTVNLCVNGNEGDVVVSFRLNREGCIDSVKLISSFRKKVSEQAIQVLLKTNKMWTPTLINGKPEPFTYKMHLKYRSFKSKSSKKSLEQEWVKRSVKLRKKGKYEKALKILNRRLKKNWFSTLLLKERAEVYHSMGEDGKAMADIKSIEKIQKELLIDVIVFAFSQDLQPYR